MGKSRHLPLIDLRTVTPDVIVELAYASPNNFTGSVVPGYNTNRALLSEPAADAIRAVQEELSTQELRLKVFDAYRPVMAVESFVQWVGRADDPLAKERYYPQVDKSRLNELGYIADQSRHSSGSTLDVTLVRQSADGAWQELDMGTRFDFFDPSSAPGYQDLNSEQIQNRQLLRQVMLKHGFEPYEYEWWHFSLRDEPFAGQQFEFEID